MQTPFALALAIMAGAFLVSGATVITFDVATRGLPKLLEELDGWLLDVFRRMHTFFRVADERTFEMKAERDGAIAAIPRRMFAFDGVGELLQRIDGAIDGGGDSGRAIAGDAMLGERTLDCGERVGSGFHDVVPTVAVNVNVDEAGRENWRRRDR